MVLFVFPDEVILGTLARVKLRPEIWGHYLYLGKSAAIDETFDAFGCKFWVVDSIFVTISDLCNTMFNM